LKFAPEGHKRVFARDASREITGTTTIRPRTCSGSSSRISRRHATWPSYSSPWFPPETTTVGPSPFAIVAIGTKPYAQPPVFEIRGYWSRPSCLPGASRSIVAPTAGGVIAAPARS
jgi:hypothetical protein